YLFHFSLIKTLFIFNLALSVSHILLLDRSSFDKNTTSLTLSTSPLHIYTISNDAESSKSTVRRNQAKADEAGEIKTMAKENPVSCGPGNSRHQAHQYQV